MHSHKVRVVVQQLVYDSGWIFSTPYSNALLIPMAFDRAAPIGLVSPSNCTIRKKAKVTLPGFK